LISIIGPTASGKTHLAVCLADLLDGEILGADSRQVYRRMNLGTGKDLSEYKLEDRIIPYHLIDIVEPGYAYNLYEYQIDFFKAFQDIRDRNKTPILCGGSGLYFESVLKAYHLKQVPPNDELRISLEKLETHELILILESFKNLHNKTDIDSRKRLIRAIEIETYIKDHPGSETSFPEISSINFCIDIERETRRNRITDRLKQRLEQGMIDEVQDLLQSGVDPEVLIYYGLEYKYITNYLQNKISYAVMFDSLNIAIHQFAKRQMTWLRGMEKRGISVIWIPFHLSIKEKLAMMLDILSKSIIQVD